MASKSIDNLKYHLRISLLCIIHLLKVLKRCEEISKTIGSYNSVDLREYHRIIKGFLIHIYRQVKILIVGAKELLKIDEKAIKDLERLEEDLEEKSQLFVFSNEIGILQELISRTDNMDTKLLHIRFGLEGIFAHGHLRTNYFRAISNMGIGYFVVGQISQKEEPQKRQMLEIHRDSLQHLFAEFKKYLHKLADNLIVSLQILEPELENLRHIQGELEEVKIHLKRLGIELESEKAGQAKSRIKVLEAELAQVEQELKK